MDENYKNNEPKKYELKTVITERHKTYWVGEIHRADGSIVNVKVSNLEKLLQMYRDQKNQNPKTD